MLFSSGINALYFCMYQSLSYFLCVIQKCNEEKGKKLNFLCVVCNKSIQSYWKCIKHCDHNSHEKEAVSILLVKL